MTCLADNDILWKLARCDLLGEAVAALRTTPDRVHCLPTARRSLLRPNRAGRPGEPTYDRLAAFLGSVRVLDATPPADELDALETIDRIDAGEAVMFAATACFPGCAVVTGDKNALRALAAVPIACPSRDRLAGRVYCFERVLLDIIGVVGFPAVLARVVPARDCDTALRAVFGSGLTATEAGVRAGLASYIADLRTHTGGLLVP